jgi:tetratricopeptide (TPR) repeat protein
MRMRSILSLAWTVAGLAAAGAWSSPAVAAPAAKAPDAPLVVRDTLAPPSGGTPSTPNDAAPGKPTGPETPAERTQRLVTWIQDRLGALQNEEIQLSMLEETNLARVVEKIDNADAAAENLFRGKLTPELTGYRQVLLTAVVQWQLLAARYVPVITQAKALDKSKASADLAPIIDQVQGRLQEKQRSLQEKVAALYQRAGDYRNAVKLYAALFQAIPVAKRPDEKKLLEKIADLYFKMEDNPNALAGYKLLFELTPEKDRYRDSGTGWRICEVLDRMKDYRNELQLLKALSEASPNEGRLKDKIRDVQKKTGQPQPATK